MKPSLPFLLFSVFLAGCQSLGPGSLTRDRSAYGEAIATSWREQMLLNVIKVRYHDTPVYLDISSVISSYTLDGEASLAGNLQPRVADNRGATLGLTGRYAESPTVSYVPLAGERLVNTLLRPIPPETVFGLIMGGARADFLLRATCQTINGIHNDSTSVAKRKRADPRFDELRERISRIAGAGALSLRLEKNGERNEAWLGFHAHEELSEDILRIKELLGLDPKLDEYRLIFGAGRHAPDEIAVLTRSLQSLTGDLAAGVEVPAEDIAEGRATAAPDAGNSRLMRVRSGRERPADALVAVRYRDRWFWIDDRDRDSKRTFMFLLMFTALVESGTVPQGPLLTIPAR
jgi:hypothetical protein